MAKRVAIVTPTFPPYRGGIGTVAQQDAEALAALGFEVHVYVPSLAGSEEQAGAQGYTVHRVQPLMRIGNGAFVPSFGKLLRTHDVVVLQYPFFGGAEPLWLAKKMGAKGKLALVYHMDVAGAGWLKSFIAVHRKVWMPSILRSADAIIATTRDYALHGDARVAAGVRPDGVGERAAMFGELPPSVDTTRFAPGPKSAELLARYGIAADTKVVTFVGGLDTPHYFKGVPAIIASLADKSLAGVHAVIVGDGDLRPSFEAKAKKLGVADRVHFAGNASDAELPDHYRLGDVFAFPSIDGSEAFGIAALEAAACGIPVVASDLPGVRTVVREGITGRRVMPGSVSMLTAALAQVLSDDAERARLGAEGRAMAMNEYSQERRPERWKKILADFRLA